MLDYVKRQLGYSYCDDVMTARLSDLIEAGQSFLSRFDPSIDWARPQSVDAWVKMLLVNLIRYELSNASDDFPINYRAELLALYHRGLSAGGEWACA